METICPYCGAEGSIMVTSYQVGNANTSLGLVFNDKMEAVDFEFNRADGEVSKVGCCCSECREIMLLIDLMECSNGK